MRMISQSVALKKCGNDNRLRNFIHSLPTTDAVPVIRCGKCRHSRELGGLEKIYFTSDCVVCTHPHGAGVSYPEYHMTGRVVWKEGFCSCGDPEAEGGADGGKD